MYLFCPKCGEEYSDEYIACFMCNEHLVESSPLQEKQDCVTNADSTFKVSGLLILIVAVAIYAVGFLRDFVIFSPFNKHLREYIALENIKYEESVSVLGTPVSGKVIPIEMKGNKSIIDKNVYYRIPKKYRALNPREVSIVVLTYYHTGNLVFKINKMRCTVDVYDKKKKLLVNEKTFEGDPYKYIPLVGYLIVPHDEIAFFIKGLFEKDRTTFEEDQKPSENFPRNDLKLSEEQRKTTDSKPNSGVQWTVVKEISYDLNNDEKLEKIVLSIDQATQELADYSRVQIYSSVEGGELLYDSIHDLVDIYGLNTGLEINDFNNNSFPEILIHEEEFPNMPAHLTIIESKVNDRFYTLFHGGLDEEGFNDFDDDGIYELYGLSGGSASELLFDRKETIYKLEGHQYKASYQLTWDLYCNKQKEAETEYQSNPGFETFIRLLTLTAIIGYNEQGEALIAEYQETNPDMDVTKLYERFEEKVNEYTDWWESLKSQDGIDY